MKVKIYEQQGDELIETSYDNIVDIEDEGGEITMWDESDENVEDLDWDDILYISEIIIIKKTK